MNPLKRKEPLVLLLGDVFFFLVSLWISLVIRNLSFPTKELFYIHLAPFGFLFIIWIVVFYIAGLYEKRTLILRSKLPGVLFNTQVINSFIGVLFFYLVPYFGISPKTLLFVYLFVSFATTLFWRLKGYFYIGIEERENAVIIGSGIEMRELMEEVNKHPLYNLNFISSVDLDRGTHDPIFLDEIISRIYSENVSLIVVDLDHPRADIMIPRLYNLIFSKVVFVDMHKIYEDVFNRVPLSLLRYNWFLENISTAPRGTYDALKRAMDFTLALIGLFVSLPFMPIIALLIKLDSKGPAFISQERFGQNNKRIKIVKFRSMITNDNGVWPKERDERVTKVGKFLRRSRIDEIPQFINVLLGDISLIGPRPDIIDLGKQLRTEIQYYNIRNIIKPGLSGWAQIHQDIVPHSVEETKERLAYDLYYIKNRSFLLDLKIVLRTIKTLVSRVGK